MEKNTQPQRDAAARIQNPTVRAIVLQPPSGTDPSGSYTGKPLDETDRPVQDADDLLLRQKTAGGAMRTARGFSFE